MQNQIVLLVLVVSLGSVLGKLVPGDCPVFLNNSETFFNRSILTCTHPERNIHFFELIGHMKLHHEYGINVFYTPYSRYLMATFGIGLSTQHMTFGISCQVSLKSTMRNWHTSFSFGTDAFGNVISSSYSPADVYNIKKYVEIVDKRDVAVRFLQAGDYFAVWGCHQTDEYQSDQAAYVFFSTEAKEIDNKTDYRYHLETFMNSLKILQPNVLGIKLIDFTQNVMSGDGIMCSKNSNISVMTTIKKHFSEQLLKGRDQQFLKKLMTSAFIAFVSIFLIVSLIKKCLGKRNSVGVVQYIA